MDKEYTLEELAGNDGQEGRPALVAHNGKVYDVSQSRLWRDGVHVRRHHAGNDLTADFAAAPHDESMLERVPQVGVVKAAPEKPRTAFEKLLDLYFGLHPHPVTVHFPVALGAVAAIFLALYLLTGNMAFEVSGYYVLWAALIATPIAMASGATSWWFNYGHSFDNRFKFKIGGSILLLVVEIVAVVLRMNNPVADRQSMNWIYAALVAVVVLHVAMLGWVGARIAFPPRKHKS